MDRVKKVYNEQDLEKLKEAGASEEELAQARKLMPENVKRRKREEKISDVVAARSRENREEAEDSKYATVDAASSVEVSATNAQIGNARQHRRIGEASLNRVSYASLSRIFDNYRRHRGYSHLMESRYLMATANKNIPTSGLENVNVPEVTDPRDLDRTLSELRAMSTAMETILEKQREAKAATEEVHREAVRNRAERRSNQASHGFHLALGGIANIGAAAGNVMMGRFGRAAGRLGAGAVGAGAGALNIVGAAIGSVQDSVDNFMEEKHIGDQETAIKETTHSKAEIETQMVVVKEAIARRGR